MNNRTVRCAQPGARLFPWLRALGFLLTAALALPAPAAVRLPANDDEIVERLPPAPHTAAAERERRLAPTRQPGDDAIAIDSAQAYLDIARREGDARYAGYALGVLQPWEAVPGDTPASIMVMRASILHFLHDYDGAERVLRRALVLQPDQAQGWITLATILRARGRYVESDAACRSVTRAGSELYGTACLAENASLRGQHNGARSTLLDLLDTPRLPSSTRQWLLTTLAETEEVAGRPAAAEVAYKKALDIEPSGFVRLVYADFLLFWGRRAEVIALLAKEPKSDAVLLRRSIASPGRDSAFLAARLEAAALRPGTQALRAREEAMLALDVDQDAVRAVRLARLNLKLQREPIDFLLMARAAAAAKDNVALAETRESMSLIGLKDARVDAIR